MMLNEKQRFVAELHVTETRHGRGDSISHITRTAELLLLKSESDNVLATYKFSGLEHTDYVLDVSPDGTAVLVSHGVTSGEYAAHRAVVLELDENQVWRVLLDNTQLPSSSRAVQSGPFIDWSDRGGRHSAGIRWWQSVDGKDHCIWHHADRLPVEYGRIMQWATIVRVVEA